MRYDEHRQITTAQGTLDNIEGWEHTYMCKAWWVAEKAAARPTGRTVEHSVIKAALVSLSNDRVKPDRAAIMAQYISDRILEGGA